MTEIPSVSQESSFQASSLNVSLTVSDLRKSLEWYRDVLGFAVDREHEREGKLFAVSLKAGNARILINQDNGAKGERAKGAGFSMMFTTAQDIDAMANRIKALGTTLETEPMDMRGMRMFRLVDPDGFRLTISSER